MIPNRRVRGDGWSVFRVPFDRRWIDGVKTMVPGSAREWNPSVKEWAIAPGDAYRVAAFTREVYGSLIEPPEAGAHRPPEPEPIRRGDADYAALHLLPSAPAGLIEAVYRHLARERHPDRGGTHEGMLGLNAAVERLRERGVA